MRKFLVILLTLTVATSLFANGAKEAPAAAPVATDKLVVYSPNSDGLLKATIPAFEQKYGVKVEVISAGSGEVFKRLVAEANAPYADVAFGGAYATYMVNEQLFQPYVSVNDSKLIPMYRNKTGYITANVLDGSVLLVNKGLIGDIKVTGYKDLLNPALKGKIISANPTASSSAFAQLTNILKAMGGYESPEAWDFVKKLFANTVVIDSSSAVWKGVRDGEYTVALSYEDPSSQLVRDGANVKIVYMSEGSVFLPAGSAIVKGAPNLVNAKRFIDFITSPEIQNVYGTSVTNRPVMNDVATPPYMTNMKDIRLLEEDMDYVYKHKADIQNKFKDIYVELKG